MKPHHFTTISGKYFSILNPTVDMVDIDAIAHALSNLCRWGGHTHGFYSVAQHSVHVSNLVPPEHALAALLHDAAEAYVGDVIGPLKALIKDYAAIEDGIWKVIAEAFHVPYKMHPNIKDADLYALEIERYSLITMMPEDASKLAPRPKDMSSWWPPMSPDGAKEVFLYRFAQLTTAK